MSTPLPSPGLAAAMALKRLINREHARTTALLLVGYLPPYTDPDLKHSYPRLVEIFKRAFGFLDLATVEALSVLYGISMTPTVPCCLWSSPVSFTSALRRIAWASDATLGRVLTPVDVARNTRHLRWSLYKRGCFTGCVRLEFGLSQSLEEDEIQAVRSPPEWRVDKCARAFQGELKIGEVLCLSYGLI